MSSVQNPFALLDIEPTYRIDLHELTEKYIAEQLKYHPDMHVTSSAEEKLKASFRAIDLNQAFEILKDPFRRGISLLYLKGVEVDLHKNEHDPQILLQTMIDQEKLEHISIQQDLEKFSEEWEARYNELENYLDDAFKKNDNELALQHLKSLKYLLKLKTELDRKYRLAN